MHLRTKLNQIKSLTLSDSASGIYHINIKLAIPDSEEADPDKRRIRQPLVFPGYFLAGLCEDKAGCQIEIMACAQKGL